jgi:LysM repeat protein
MERTSSSAARVFAAAALLCGFLVVLVVVAATLGGGGDSSGGGGGHRSNLKGAGKSRPQQQAAPKVYVVESGDTLTSIAHEMGISVARIQELNPEVDPQVLVSGEKLKLR